MTGSVAVIGAGIYGVSAALELAASGVDVTLYERDGDILRGATSANFFRVHRGYHYPRDEQTARQSLSGYASFMGLFAEALTPAVPHYYAIAAEGSLTSPEEFSAHCARLGLEARPAMAPGLVPGSVAACFEVMEYYYDPDLLRAAAWQRLEQAGVPARLGWDDPQLAARLHDVTVVTAYSALNEVLAGLRCPPAELQYEMCEVAVIDAPGLPAASVTVLDGPFCSLAPFGERHILYDVVHSVRARATGFRAPRVPARLGSNAGAMLAPASRFVTGLDGAVHAGSLYAMRAVLPRVDDTDARPARCWWASDRVLAVLSGKVTASVLAGREVTAKVTARLGLPNPEPVLLKAMP